VGLTHVTAADRDRRSAVDSARRLDARHAVLAATSIVAVLAIAFPLGGRRTANPFAVGSPGDPPPVNLNAITSPAELIPLFAPVFADANDRRFAATHLHQFVMARRDGGDSLPNVGAILQAQVGAGAIQRSSTVQYKERLAAVSTRARDAGETPPTTLGLVTREDLAALKPLAAVRAPATYRGLVIVWGAVYLACVWLVAVAWWVRGVRGEYPLLAAAHLLTALGFAALLGRQDPLRDTALFVRHAQLTSAGLVCFALVSGIDVRKVARTGLSYLPLIGALVLSAALILFGGGPAGSNTKVNLGPLQPVEFIRLLLALFLAGYFARRWELLRQVRGANVRTFKVPGWLNLPRVDYVLPVAAGVAAALLFFFLQKDLGPALFLTCVFLMTYAIARQGVSLALVGFALLVAGFYAGYTLNVSSTLTARVAMWGSTWDNGARGGEQIAQAIWGLSTGGLSGTGLGLGDTRYVPAGHTDLMLAAIGEELGFVGLFSVAVLFVIIAARGFRAGLRAADDHGFFLATVLTLFLTVPVLVMAAGMLGVVPLTGVVTPFLSFGGSAMLANFIALGMITSIGTRPATSPDVTAPFHAGVRRLGAALGAGGLALVAVLFDVQVLRADAYVARPYLGIQADGFRRYQYNQRLTDVLAAIPRGTVFDRRGLPLSTGDPAIARRAHEQYRKAGVEHARCPTPFRERCYPLGGAAFHLLGDARDARNWSASNTAYVERDSQNRLRGFDDHATTVRVSDASGRPAAAVRRDYRAIVPLLRHRHSPDHPAVMAFLNRPRDLTITIDAPLQASVARVLSKYASRSSTGHAAAVVLDPDTGDLLAIGSHPFPNLSEEPGGSREHDVERLLDRARFGLYPPGSTFKLVTASAALRQDPALRHHSFTCSLLSDGRVGARVGGWGVVRDDVLDRRPHGTVEMHDGVVHSCNAYFAQLAVRVGARSLLDTANLLGISVAKDNSLARLRETLPQAGYGQGDVVVTPLRMARVAAAIASHGVLRDVRIERSPAPASTETLLTPAAAAILARDLRDVVLAGTGRSLREHPGRIAGKTGTAEVGHAPSHAWFVGYAPYGPAEKRVAFAVIVENAGYGGSAAAPAAGEIVSAAAASGLIEALSDQPSAVSNQQERLRMIR
jgi:cell division protein FtsW (lipid II flippase)